jgi:hypothetical protein
MTPGHQLAHDIKGTGPLLVAVHGITENRGFWDPVRLHQHFRVLRVDLRGHGESPRISPFGIDASVEDIHRLIESAARYPTPGVVTIDQSPRVGPLPTRMCSAAFGPRCSIPHLAQPAWLVSRVREFFGG